MKMRLEKRNFVVISLFFAALFINIGCSKDDSNNDGTNSNGSAVTILNPVINSNGPITSDIEGNKYPSITIKWDTYKSTVSYSQTWMIENLKTTKYKDGTPIQLVTDDNIWVSETSSAPYYCWFNNDISNKNVYGALYNWYTVNTGKLCPAGWHVPTESEWLMLISFVGGEGNAGGNLKEKGTNHWWKENVGATDKIGFTALPGGCRTNIVKQIFNGMGGNCYFWTSTEQPGGNAIRIGLWSQGAGIDHLPGPKTNGFSVRCIMD